MDDVNGGAGSWLRSPLHKGWLAQEGLRLLGFAKASRLPEGFGALDDFGRLPADAVAETLITARMTHSFAMAHISGIPGFAELVDHGIAALAGPLRDAEHGGWFDRPQAHTSNTGKAAYLHAFVALAASSAVVAQRPGAQALLEQAIQIITQHFWSEEEGTVRESFARDWTEEESYRGANSNMHSTETFLALADVTGDGRWLDRALRIVERVIHQHAASNNHQVIEHFTADWQPVLDYNADRPGDEFRPYGTTPGHAFEWARLVLHLEAARQKAQMPTPSWLLEDARGLFENACRYGWDVDGAPGIVYTLDWENRPVVRHRLHWTHAEAAAASAALLQRTGEAQYEAWYRTFWEFNETLFIDREHGSWRHELNPQNQPSADIWPGKPDLYHAYQATLLPVLPLAESLATGLAHYA
ncbi:AGE family epimerase/isomerase [Pseudomonas sp. NPDC090201]|uniref:D-mannose isomerase n=1 Tax=Pseudomonas sp. NPDC090201 TaxID=3364475 RepID=UPI0038286EDB